MTSGRHIGFQGGRQHKRLFNCLQGPLSVQILPYKHQICRIDQEPVGVRVAGGVTNFHAWHTVYLYIPQCGN